MSIYLHSTDTAVISGVVITEERNLLVVYSSQYMYGLGHLLSYT
jgi:hypothetical protein